MCRQTDEWVYRQADQFTDRHIKLQIDVQANRQIFGWNYRQADGQTHRPIDLYNNTTYRQLFGKVRDESTVGQMNVQTDRST